MKEVTYRFDGITPLLMNNVNSMFKAKEKPARSKPDEWEQGNEMFTSRMYINKAGTELALPERVLRGLVYDAAKKSGIKQAGKRTTYADLVQSVLFFPYDALLEQDVSEVVREQAFVGMNGTKKVLRVWPKLENWNCDVKIIVTDEKQFPLEILDEILQFAGDFVGVGDYRPQFGRFKAKRI